jgi:hypothetical protein
LFKKKKAELVPKICATFPMLKLKLNPDMEDLTWSEIEALDKALRRQKFDKRR